MDTLDGFDGRLNWALICQRDNWPESLAGSLSLGFGQRRKVAGKCKCARGNGQKLVFPPPHTPGVSNWCVQGPARYQIYLLLSSPALSVLLGCCLIDALYTICLRRSLPRAVVSATILNSLSAHTISEKIKKKNK